MTHGDSSSTLAQLRVPYHTSLQRPSCDVLFVNPSRNQARAHRFVNTGTLAIAHELPKPRSASEHQIAQRERWFCVEPSWRVGDGGLPEYPVRIPGRAFVRILPVCVVRRITVIFSKRGQFGHCHTPIRKTQKKGGTVVAKPDRFKIVRSQLYSLLRTARTLCLLMSSPVTSEAENDETIGRIPGRHHVLLVW